MSFDFFNQNAVQPGGGPELGPNGEEILIDVRCGRINVEGKTMKPDDRKGKLRICKATDGLTHLMWGTRAEGMPYNPEDDFIIFPQEAQMKFIPKPGCFVIKFPDDASRNMFFWSQEPAGKIEDDKLVADINAALNGESPESANEQAQLMQMLGDAGGAGLAARDPSGGPVAARAQAVRAAHEAANSALAAPPAGPDETPAVNANAVPETPAAPAKGPDPSAGTAVPPSVVNAEALRAALGSSVGATPASTPGAGAIDAAAMAAALAGANRRAAGPGLSDVLTPDAVGELLRSEDVRQRLMEHLPEEHRSTQDLEELLRTPQFQSQLERFSHALQSGQMDLAQFGLSPGAGFSVAEFLSAIQKQVEETEGGDAMQE